MQLDSLPKIINIYRKHKAPRMVVRLIVDVPPEVAADLIAISYCNGSKGVTSRTTRTMLMEAIEAWKKSVTGTERREFKEILRAVQGGMGILVDQAQDEQEATIRTETEYANAVG